MVISGAVSVVTVCVSKIQHKIM